MHHFIVNVNSKSGKGIRIWTLVKKELDQKGIDYICYFTKYVGHAKEIARDICNEYEGIKNLVILGGDGTLNEVINGIPRLDDVILGYIPTGSSNDFARSMNFPTNPLVSLEHILYPRHFDFLDIGEVKIDNNITHRFCVSSGVGFDAAICHETIHSPIKKVLNKYGLGKLTYIIIALKQLFGSKTMDGYIIREDGSTKHYKNILLLTTMVHKYQGGGVKMAPSADPKDGKLSICFVYGLSKLKTLFILPTLSVGLHTKFKGIECFDCKRIKLNTSDPEHLHHDGEVPGKFNSYEFTCLHKKLRVIV